MKSIHFKRTLADQIEAGNSCCFQIKSTDSKFPLKKEHIRKGMVLLEKQSEYKTYREFEAEVIILHHATTIKPKYQAVIHAGVVRQTAQVLSIKDKELLRTGDKGLIHFRFINSPEYIHLGANILFREGRTRGLGQITSLIEETKDKDKEKDKEKGRINREKDKDKDKNKEKEKDKDKDKEKKK